MMSDELFVQLRREGYNARLATAEDWPQVHAINKKIYFGLDYLPHFYQEVISDPDRLCGVVVHEGTIVAFGMWYLVDDGETILSEAGRVHPDHEHKGLQKLMINHLQTLAPASWQNVQRIVWIGRVTDELEKLIKTIPDLKVTLKQHYVSYQIAATEMPSKLAGIRPKLSHSIDDITLMTSQDISAALKRKADTATLYPEGIVVANWEPYYVNKASTARTILKRITRAYASLDGHNGSIKALSFGTAYYSDSKKVIVYDMDYSGITDVNLMISHFVKHLSYVEIAYTADTVFGCMHFPARIDKEAIGDAFDRALVGFKEGHWLKKGSTLVQEMQMNIAQPFQMRKDSHL